MYTSQELAYYLIPRAMGEHGYVSVPRLIKLMYLSDWREALLRDTQITEIKWVYGKCGPASDQLYEQLKQDVGVFCLAKVNDRFGNPKEVISIAKDVPMSGLTEAQKDSADYILALTKDRKWESLTALVTSTYPIATREPGAALDLPILAGEYRKNIIPLLRRKKL